MVLLAFVPVLGAAVAAVPGPVLSAGCRLVMFGTVGACGPSASLARADLTDARNLLTVALAFRARRLIPRSARRSSTRRSRRRPHRPTAASPSPGIVAFALNLLFTTTPRLRKEPVRLTPGTITDVTVYGEGAWRAGLDVHLARRPRPRCSYRRVNARAAGVGRCGQRLTPGLVNTHTHLIQAGLRGIGEGAAAAGEAQRRRRGGGRAHPRAGLRGPPRPPPQPRRCAAATTTLVVSACGRAPVAGGARRRAAGAARRRCAGRALPRCRRPGRPQPQVLSTRV